MATTKVTFQGTYRRLDGSIPTGTVSFALGDVRTVNNGIIVQDVVETATLDVNGAFTIDLVWLVEGYRIVETIDSIPYPQMTIAPPVGSVHDLGSASKADLLTIQISGEWHDPDDSLSTGHLTVTLDDDDPIRQVVNGYIIVTTPINVPIVNGFLNPDPKNLLLLPDPQEYKILEHIDEALTDEFYAIAAQVSFGLTHEILTDEFGNFLTDDDGDYILIAS